MSRKNYTVILTIADDGTCPRIAPERLYRHITVELPAGLEVVKQTVTDEEEDDQ